MKRFNFPAIAALALFSFSCNPVSVVNLTVDGISEGRTITVKTSFGTLDSLRTDRSGSVCLKTSVQKTDPEFVHFYLDDTNVASAILKSGDRIKVSADTLRGAYSITGSQESSQMLERINASVAFNKAVLSSLDDRKAMGKLYIEHYRDCVRFLMENPKSLACIPVLFEKIGENSPLFSQNTDAIYFQTIADSLKTLYPDSRYVKSLEREAAARFSSMQMKNRLSSAENIDFPHIELPDINGEKVAIENIGSKVILLHFWDASNAAQKMFNIDVLLPLFNKYKDKGFDIYSVCVTPDKAMWAGVVKAQKLPWTNVNDGKGVAGAAVRMYNVQSVPCSYLISSKGIVAPEYSGNGNLDKAISELLR